MRKPHTRLLLALLLVSGGLLAWWLFSADPQAHQAPAKTLVERLIRSSRSRVYGIWKSAGGKPAQPRPRVGNKQATPDPKSRAASVELSIQVVDDRQAPVKGAQIELRQSRTSGKALSTLTPADGKSSIKTVPGIHDLRVTHAKYAPYTAQVNTSLNMSTNRVRVVLLAAAEVRGKVRDEEGRALARVQILSERRRVEHLVSGATTYINDAAYAPAQSDADGNFVLLNIAAGVNRFAFSLEGHATAEQTIEVPAGGLNQPLQVVLRRPAFISGRVMDEQQQPITSATIRVVAFRQYGSADIVSTQTIGTVSDTTGSFILKHLLSGVNYDIRVEHPQYATAIYPRVPSDAGEQIWVLNRGGDISGRATFIDRPTTTARVLLELETVLQGTTFSAQTMTNADGTWAIDRLPYSQYRITVDYEGFVHEPRSPVTSAGDKPTTGVLVELYEALTLTGKAVDAASDMPVPGAKISANSSYGYFSTRSRSFTATTDVRGNFRLPRLPAGSHLVIGRAEDYLPSNAGGNELRISLRPGEPQDELIVPMSRGGSVEGYVRGAEHEGLPGAEVQLFVASTTASNFPVKDLHTVTDGGGRFVISGFPLSDRVQLYASATKPGYAKARSPLIELTAKAPLALTNITMSAGGVVMGKVTDTAGRPLNQVKMTFESREFLGDPTPSSFSALTGADGVYLLEHCTPGAMRVTASRNDYVTQVRSGTVKEGALLNNFNFKLLSASKIAGTVADFSGRPIAGARVTATPLEKATGYGTATTDKTGEFSFPNLSQGFFRIEASFPLSTPDGTQNYTFIAPRVKSGTLGLPIDCDIEPSVRAQVDTDDGKRLDRFNLAMRSQLDTNPPQQFRFNLERRLASAGGEFRVLKVPRGIYTLEIRADGYEPYRSEDVVVGPGLNTTLPSIRMRSSTGIDGTVVSATTGRAIANVTVRVLDTERPETVTVNRLELSAYPRQDVVEYLDAWYDTNADIDPNRQFRPVARVRANVATTTKSDYSGKFKVTGTPPGQYTLEFEHPSYSMLKLDRVSVTRTNATDVGEVQLSPGGELRGHVVDGQGRPIYSANIVVRGERQGRGSTRSDLGGNYLFRGISPGHRTVVVRTVVSGRSLYAYAFAEVREDQSTPLNFILALDANVHGTLVSPDTPVRAGAVRLYPLDENGAVLPDIHYDATARGPSFTIAAVPAGSYAAVATGTAAGAFSLWQMIDVNRGDNPVSLPLGAATISGVTINTAGAVAGVKLQLRPDPATTLLPPVVYNLLVRNATTSATGKFTFAYLPAGLHELSYSSAGGAPTTPAGQLMVAPGQRITGYRLEVP